MSPTTDLHLGETVLYTLSKSDADAVNTRRKDYTTHRKFLNDSVPADVRTVDIGHQGHVGNEVTAGEQYPAVLVRDWGGCWNLRVQLDGADVYWATSVSEGTGPSRFQRISATTSPAAAAGNTADLHPSVSEILRWFEYDHLPEHLQAVCKPIHALAHDLAGKLSGAQLTHGLHALWQAKNYFVTAAIAV